MKTKLIIEITSPDESKIFPEEGQTMKDFKGAKKQKELEKHRKNFAKDLHKRIVSEAKDHFKDGNFEDKVMEDIDDLGVEDWFDFSDYGIKIKTKVEKE